MLPASPAFADRRAPTKECSMCPVTLGHKQRQTKPTDDGSHLGSAVLHNSSAMRQLHALPRTIAPRQGARTQGLKIVPARNGVAASHVSNDFVLHGKAAALLRARAV